MGIIPIQSNSQNLLCKSPTFSTSPLALLHWISGGMASKHVLLKCRPAFRGYFWPAGPPHLQFPLLCGFSVIRPLFAHPLNPPSTMPPFPNIATLLSSKKVPKNRSFTLRVFLSPLGNTINPKNCSSCLSKKCVPIISVLRARRSVRDKHLRFEAS